MTSLTHARTYRPFTIAALLLVGGCTKNTCEYGYSLETVPRFSFAVTLPYGSARSCSTRYWLDGGVGLGWPLPLNGEVTGWVTAAKPTMFSLDTCAAGTGCSPGVYRVEIDSPGLALALPLGRKVTVSWQISFFMGCVQQLAVHDVSPSSAAPGTSGGLWLAGAEGIFQPSMPLPFTVDHQRLYCNSHSGDVHPCGAGAPYPDVYALVFTSTSGEPPLSLTSSWTGTIVVTTVPELQQHLGIRTLRSFQSDRCDDYYNWRWWAAGHAGPSGQLE